MTNTGVSDISVPQAWSPDDILDTREAAAYLRLSVSSLNKMRCTGSGPAFIRTGRPVRYRRRSLDFFVDSRCTTSTTDADCRLPTRLSEALVQRPKAKRDEADDLPKQRGRRGAGSGDGARLESSARPGSCTNNPRNGPAGPQAGVCSNEEPGTKEPAVNGDDESERSFCHD
jgi:hypothetical protein